MNLKHNKATHYTILVKKSIKMEHASFWKEFFEIYRDLPALWRVKCAGYSDRALKAKCYIKLIRKLQEINPEADREMVVKKINNFRTSYRKERKRMKECREMGRAYKPTLWYFDYLRFLDGHDELENTEEKKQESEDVAVKPEIAAVETTTAPKRSAELKDSDEEFLPLPPRRKKLTHHFHKNTWKKPTIAEQQEAKNEAGILAKSWAVQYKGMRDNQKLIARKLISDILFYGCLGSLKMSNVIDLQEIFLKQPTNPLQLANLQPQSPIQSNSSLHFAEQEFFNYNSSLQESPIEFNSSSPAMSPTNNSIADIQVNDIKLEVP